MASWLCAAFLMFLACCAVIQTANATSLTEGQSQQAIASELGGQADGSAVLPTSDHASLDPMSTTSSKAPSNPLVTSPSTAVPGGIDTVLVLDECFVVEACIDRFLEALYVRAPKIDWIVAYERKNVTIKRKGKLVTITRNISKRVESDFGWKDPKAAEKAGVPLMDYVIGGMDRAFKLKLFYILNAAEQAGLAPGITSGFRDDYRQSIASGLKAENDKSYHGGSSRGGYSHGLAADVISVNGRTKEERVIESQRLWKWIDEHGKQFGVGRPYLSMDPPHLAPIDGQEYASHRTGSKHAKLSGKRHTRVAASSTLTGARAKSKKVSKRAMTRIGSRA
ncbi:D-alanyl-D-alanine carboxypeptidase family protein [Bradyrhizobium sp. ma5]|uniref:D-alanyl-D-alanine carboxypeptidase family protein n=1 Tax=Bradyrhizobium sp. ma5 TaxID=3344828 RepID=UPI0035D3EADC